MVFDSETDRMVKLIVLFCRKQSPVIMRCRQEPRAQYKVLMIATLRLWRLNIISSLEREKKKKRGVSVLPSSFTFFFIFNLNGKHILMDN